MRNEMENILQNTEYGFYKLYPFNNFYSLNKLNSRIRIGRITAYYIYDIEE